jgi:MFS family permease
MMIPAVPLTITTSKNRDIIVALYAALITFLTYAAVYAFRKPFTVGAFTDAPKVFGLVYKDALVISQVLGYMLSKFYGIRFIAELNKSRRGKIILFLIGVSWLALLLFAVVPPPYNVIFLFANGFPLGMIWGIIFSYVEGRKASDFIGASLAVSFIFSSGFVKSAGKWLMINFSVTEWWLPFVTGLVFIFPVILLVLMLEKIPLPSDDDVSKRAVRLSMGKEERGKFFSQFKRGLVFLIIIYVFLTIFRDIRDNFAAEIWRESGYGDHPSVFTATEIPITIIILMLIGSMILIRNNHRAFIISHLIILSGFLLAGISSWAFINQLVTPFTWMTLVGMGLYMGYIPFNCILFDRMIATFKYAGNAGFLMYLADSFGYLGSVGVILIKTIFDLKIRWTTFYSNGVMYISVIGVIGTLLALQYFINKHKKIFAK